MNIFIALKYMEICDNIHVTAAGNGAKGLMEFVMEEFDIILTDADMPVMDEYQLAGKVRTGFSYPKSAAPIILLTAENALLDEMKKVGIDARLLQPFKRGDLYKVVYDELITYQIMQFQQTGGRS